MPISPIKAVLHQVLSSIWIGINDHWRFWSRPPSSKEQSRSLVQRRCCGTPKLQQCFATAHRFTLVLGRPSEGVTVEIPRFHNGVDPLANVIFQQPLNVGMFWNKKRSWKFGEIVTLNNHCKFMSPQISFLLRNTTHFMFFFNGRLSTVPRLAAFWATKSWKHVVFSDFWTDCTPGGYR